MVSTVEVAVFQHGPALDDDDDDRHKTSDAPHAAVQCKQNVFIECCTDYGAHKLSLSVVCKCTCK